MSAKKKNSTYNAFNDGMKAFEKKRGIKTVTWREQGRLNYLRRLEAEDATPEPVDFDIGRGEV